jgi:hypothetical protein
MDTHPLKVFRFPVTITSAIIVFVVLLFVPILCFGDDENAPTRCGKCHQAEYLRWTQSGHFRNNVVCRECHGEPHSANLQGCRKCHGEKHAKMISRWPEVRRFDPPNSSDYVCIVCHRSHRGGLDPRRKICTACHGAHLTPNAMIGFHTGPAEAADPTENDGFALLQRDTWGSGTLTLLLEKMGSSQNRSARPYLLAIFLTLIYPFGVALFLPPVLGLLIIIRSANHCSSHFLEAKSVDCSTAGTIPSKIKE